MSNSVILDRRNRCLRFGEKELALSYNDEAGDDAQPTVSLESLLEMLGDVDYTDYCGEHGAFLDWEKNVARRLLADNNVDVGRFFTAEGDSFGPLVRGVRLYFNTKIVTAYYG